MTLLDRFNKYWTPEPYSGCWLWIGYERKDGYGQIWANGKSRFAHRVSWELSNGAIPTGAHVCHSCDTPLCVNPNHLFLGTQKENIRDSISKGRFTIGTRNGQSKLTPAQVIEIRSCRKTKSLARKYGVSGVTIKNARSGRMWKHV